MALSDKDIIITPNRGQAADPKIVFSGASSTLGPQTITLNVYPTSGGTLSWEGSAGQLFSITNSLTGTIYSVNDVSGIPSIEVLDTGLVKIAQYSGNVLIGTGTDDGSKLQLRGSLRTGNNGWNASPTGTFFSHTLAANAGTTRVVNFDGTGNLPSVWWTNGARAYGAIDAQDPGLTFWANNGSAWQKQITLNYGSVNFETTLQNQGYQVLHANNYNNYSPTLTGGGASGTWAISITGNADTVDGIHAASFLRTAGSPGYGDWDTFGNTIQTVHQISQENFNTGTNTGSTNFPTSRSYSYGTLINFGSGDSARAQVYISHAGNDLIFRGGWSTGSWQSWNKVLTDLNYNSYSPTLTGSNASGTWGINITGSAGALTGGDSNFYALLYNGNSGDLNTYNSPGLYSSEYTGGTNNPTGSTGQNGHWIQISDAGGTDVKTQWYYHNAGSDISMRLMWGNGYWKSWRKLLHDGNYTSYSPTLTGGGASGTWAISITGSASYATYGQILDTRAAQYTPNDYQDYRTTFEFTNQIVGSDWHTALTMQGWTNGYSAWQIIGPASTSAHENWYLRSGINTTWNSLRAILHSGNYTSYVGNGAMTVTAGSGLTGGGQVGTANQTGASSVTISHADTSSVANLSSDNSNGIVLQDLAFTFDTYGHVTGASAGTVDLDTRYLQLTGGTVTGRLAVSSEQVLGQERKYYIGNLSASNAQARRFEIARIYIDYNDWHAAGIIKVELQNNAYFGGDNQVWNISFDYNNINCDLVYSIGPRGRQATVTCGAATQISGDYYYLPIYVDVRYYSQYYVYLTTSWPETNTHQASSGAILVYTAPAGSNISDFTASDAMAFRATSLALSGNTVLHTANYNSYSPTLTGGGASGTWAINITGSAPASSLTGQTGMWTSATRPGPYRLYRRDDDSNYSVQTYWTGTLWRLYGYNGDSVHADTHVGYADLAGSANEIDGIPFRNGNSTNVEAPNNINQNGIGYINSVSLLGQSDGALYSQAYSSSWVHQIFGDYRTGQLVVRGRNNGTWQSWRTVLDSGNYNSYSPTLTGTGASGTWAISITGNADTVDNYHVAVAGTANTIPTRNASGYLAPNNWIQLDGTYGLYSSTNAAHFYPNNASYGSWRVAGSRNSWSGLEFDGSNGNTTLMFGTDSNTVGLHNNTYGWRFRVIADNGYLYSGTYGGGSERAILHSGNYSSYALPLSGGTITGTLTTSGAITSGSSTATGGGQLTLNGLYGSIIIIPAASSDPTYFRSSGGGYSFQRNVSNVWTTSASIDSNGNLNVNGIITGQRYNETYATAASSSGSLTINCNSGNVFQVTLTENVTSTSFSNPPASGTAYGFTLRVIQGSPARTITWPTSVDWPGGTAPTLSSGSGEVDVFTFFTTDGGTIWYGFTAGKDLS